jgi:hypothetical protein
MPEIPKIDEFAFVLLAGLVLIIMMMVSFPVTEENVTTNLTNVTTVEGENARFIKFGDFTVSYSIGSEVVDSRENEEVAKSYFYEKQINLLSSFTDDKLSIITEGTIQLIVSDTTYEGNLIVLFNDKEIFNKKVGPGEVNIRIDRSLIKKSNIITIKTQPPGWKFWMTNVYRFKTVKFIVNYHGVSFKDFEFNMDYKEIEKLRYGRLEFGVKDFNAVDKLTIKINNVPIWDRVPPLTFFRQDFGPEMTLYPGKNIISFSVGPNAYYSLSDVTLMIVWKT